MTAFLIWKINANFFVFSTSEKKTNNTQVYRPPPESWKKQNKEMKQKQNHKHLKLL